MGRSLAWGVWLAFSLGCAFHVAAPKGAPEGVQLVDRPDENRPFIQVDGGIWLVDTGYSRTTCDDAFAAAAGVPVDAHGGGVAWGEAGTVRVGRAVLEDVTIGGWTFARLPCAVRDLQTTSSVGEGVVGVLGSNVLRHFRLRLRYHAHELWLERERVARPDGAARLRPEGGFGARRVGRLHVNGQAVTVVVDTGADRTYLPLDSGVVTDRYTARQLGTGPSGGRTVEIVFHAAKDVTLGDTPLHLGSYVERRRRGCLPVDWSWLPDTWTEGPCPFVVDGWRDGLLGMDALGGEDLVLDYRAGWLVHEPG